MRTEGKSAWESTLQNPHHRWAADLDRFRRNFTTIGQKPKFTISSADRFFCIGSCFARNIEEQLVYRGLDVLSKSIICPKEESPIRPNGFTNKFTTPSISNELEWIASSPPDEILVETEAGWIDSQLAPAQKAVTRERAVERRRYLSTEYFPRLRHADIVVMTLGLNEVWFDARCSRYWNCAPSFWQVRREPGRFFFERTDYWTNLAQLDHIRALIKELNPSMRIVLTVSPVPLTVTFSGTDAAVANTYSKAVLRAAAQAFSDAHADSDYFPSYELAMLSRREAAFSQVDFSHVMDTAVESIVDHFVAAYIGAIPRPHPNFVEALYLDANPDVDWAVRTGRIDSGYRHYVQHGEREGRPLRSNVPPSWAQMVGFMPVD